MVSYNPKMFLFYTVKISIIYWTLRRHEFITVICGNINTNNTKNSLQKYLKLRYYYEYLVTDLSSLVENICKNQMWEWITYDY